MKKIILINLIILLSLSKIYSQDKTFLSTEFNTNYFYYFLGENNNKFNYGFSLQLSENIDKFKISFGAIYATKYYWDKPSEKYNKCEYLLKNIRLQIIGNYQIISKILFQWIF